MERQEHLTKLAREYIAIDFDTLTRSEIEDFLEREEWEVLSKRLEGRLRFGTAGIRGKMGGGWMCMNLVTVVGAMQGVLRVLEEQGSEEADKSRGVIVGYDGRRESERMAKVCAAACVECGMRVGLFGGMVPTPVVGYAVKKEQALAGIVITASHNPKDDNGFKVFWSDGCQILPSVAKKIEKAIRQNEKPWKNYEKEVAGDEMRLNEYLVWDPKEDTLRSYVEDATRCLRTRDPKQNSKCKPAIYTALHGVGKPIIEAMFSSFGLPPCIPVAEQMDPDPTFPTLKKPNPEEKGALDMALKLAEKKGIQLVLANDPDADRLGVAEYDLVEQSATVFTGDQIALLLADHLWKNRGEMPSSEYAMIASAVSSKILQAMADKEGFEFREALTGFKWLSHTALDLKPKEVLLTYEEALGYMIGSVVQDKDGITAAAVMAETAANLYEQGTLLKQRLDTLFDRYGHHIGLNGYLTLPPEGPELGKVFDAARDRGFPGSFGDLKVVSIRDLTRGTDSGSKDEKALLPKDSSSQFLTFRCLAKNPSADCSDGKKSELPATISLRGSGTEPKCKYYSEIVCDRKDALSGSALRMLKAGVAAVIENVLEPQKNGFKFDPSSL